MPEIWEEDPELPISPESGESQNIEERFDAHTRNYGWVLWCCLASFVLGLAVGALVHR